MLQRPTFGIGRVTRFYIPLLLQAFSQELTYPLVAGIVTHGLYGVYELAAFAQGQMIMFMIGAFGGGLMMTGMVFAINRKGFLNYKRLNTAMMISLLIIQCIPALPPFDRWVFEGAFSLPPHLARIARDTLVWGVIMNGGFFLRNVPLVILFNNLQSGKANIATFARIVVTLLAAALFPRFGWTGAGPGLFALTLGCLVELALTWYYARLYTREVLEERTVAKMKNSVLAQFRFTLPLSFGGLLLMMSPIIIATFISRVPNAADMLAIHYVTIGVANPVAYAALRMQAVAIEFPPEYEGDKRLLIYSIFAGLILGLILAVFATPLVSKWYFGSYQNVPAHILDTARLAIGIYSFIAVVQALRGRLEGVAAIHHKPRAVMAGQIAYTCALFLTLFVLRWFNVPGWLMAVSAVMVSPICVILAIWLCLRRTKMV